MQSYRGTLKGNRIEWTDSPPSNSDIEQEVEVTIVRKSDSPNDWDRGRRMAEALERLAKSNALAHITDPVAWQREIRKDRPLPYRDE